MKEAMKLACKALRDCHYYMINAGLPNQSLLNEAFTAYMELEAALAEQPAQQDSTCSNALRAQGKAYPRTCKKCGLGICIELANKALDKMAENARELGLDYEPATEDSLVVQPAPAQSNEREIRNATLDEIAAKIDRMPFGDTAASFAVWIREQKQ